MDLQALAFHGFISLQVVEDYLAIRQDSRHYWATKMVHLQRVAIVVVNLVTEAFAFIGNVSDLSTELEEDCYYFLLWGCSEESKTNSEEC